MFKTILVHSRGTTGDMAALEAALRLGSPFDAHLECLHVRPSFGSLISRAAMADFDEDTDVTSQMLRTLQDENSEAAQRAADTFHAFCTKEGLPRAEMPPGPGKRSGAFRQAVGDEVESLIAQSRYNDVLVVKSGYEQAGGLFSRDVGRLITSTGRPVVLAPDHEAQPIRTAVIAWKNTPEAARAVAAAMPILEKAQKVFVVTASEAEEQVSDCEAVVKQLCWHGVLAEGHHVVPGERNPAHAVLETARAANADLLVMGAYGRNRLSEVILGGFTESVLDDASLPVFMMH